MSAMTPPDAGPATVHITLGVLTFRRPEGIDKLLGVLRAQHRDPARPWLLSVVVVDNDAAGSSREAVMAHAGHPEYTLEYVVEPEQGIPIARNRAMDCAPMGTELFCFLDDDEWPVDGWLDSMLRTRAETGADCVYGPIEPVFEGPIDDWLRRSRLYDRKRYREGERLDFAASNNVMFDLARFRALDLRFDARMRFTGGSDYLFFNQAVRRGIRIHWCEAALVYDLFPANRLTMRWQRQRQYRLGNTFAVATRIEGDTAEKARQLARGVARMALGTVMSPAMLVSPYWGGRAMVHMLRGAGLAVGILGHSYQEYAPKKLKG
jgi:glycosyltransferase involved in cell wall biosynthesis